MDQQPMQELLNAMASDGVVISGFQPDGEMHRDDSLWAIAWQNITQAGQTFYVAMYGDWKGGREFKFTSNVRLDRQDKARVDEQVALGKRRAAEAKARSQAKSAAEAKELLDSLPETGTPTPYMASKGLGAFFGARPSGWSIVIPMRDVDGKLWSVQTVDEQSKLYFKGGRVQGCMHVIGELTSPIYLAEGFATAVSVHLATGKGVVCAFDCGNLLPVGTAIKSKFKDAELIICGDDDLWSTKMVDGREVPYNGGRTKAELAATKLFARVVFPRFTSLDGKPTDFNDLHLREGLETVWGQLSAAALPAAIDWTAEVQTIDQLTTRDLTAILPHWNWSRPTDRNPESVPTTPMATVDNFRALFKSLGVTIRYNMISKADEVFIPGLKTTVDNQANVVVAHFQSWCERLKIKATNLLGYITAIADENAYNPVLDWIKEKPWDGEDRLDAFYKTLTVEDEGDSGDGLEKRVMKETLVHAWLVQAVSALIHPTGLSASGVLVLLGAQYMGKTHWFKRLVPSSLKRYIADGVTLDTTQKDSVLNVLSHWLVELGELDATFKKSDIAHLKAFVTKECDKIRRPYAKAESEYGRRTVFFASVNDRRFLKDPTGNRRFWTLACSAIDWGHQIDMQQLWAQVLHQVEVEGQTHYLSPELIPALNEHNDDFRERDPIEEKLASDYAWDAPKGLWRAMTATQIAEDMQLRTISKKELNQIASTMREAFGQNADKTKRGRYFMLPPSIRNYANNG